MIGKIAFSGVRVEEVSDSEIRISAGTFVPDSQKTFYAKESMEALSEFSDWETKKPATATNTKVLFTELKKNQRNKRRGK